VGVSPHHPLFTPDGKLGMVVAQGPGTLDLFDPATWTATGSIKVGAMPHWIGMTSDGRWAYVTNENSNDVSVIDLADRSVKATVPVGNAPRKIVVQPGASVPAAAMTDMPGMAQPTPAPATSSSAPLAAVDPAQDSVSISNFAFSPKSLTVGAGQSVTFTNNDSVAHTTTTSSAWDSGDIQPGASYRLSVPSTAGTYAFHCSIHPFMTGTLIVQ
jgi:YVTN family beta-propeller protein